MFHNVFIVLNRLIFSQRVTFRNVLLFRRFYPVKPTHDLFTFLNVPIFLSDVTIRNVF